MARGIVMTGASGLLGGALLAELLIDQETSVCCVLRAGDADHLERRREDLVREHRLDEDQQRRLTAVAGDIEQERFGLDPSELTAVAGPVSEFIHCAASTRFDLDLDEARRVNVAGAMHLVELARLVGDRLERVHHVSTAYVVGDTEASVLGLQNVGTGRWRNSYEQSKWEAEEVLHGSGLPVAVYRPSIVVGDSRSGATPHFRVLYEPIKWIARGITDVVPCDPSIRIDVVPVDFVAAAIVALSADSSLDGTRLLTAGPERALSIADIAEMSLEMGNDCLGRHGRDQVEGPRLVAPQDPDAEELYALGALVMQHHAPYMLKEQLFRDEATETLLAERGVLCPNPVDYWHQIIDFAVATDFGRLPLPPSPR